MNETREYSRDSFERFGDDLCEEMLSHLTLDDCFGYECVSKQFKRCVFNKQKKLKVSYGNDINHMTSMSNYLRHKLIMSRIENMITKCVYINEINTDFVVYDQMMAIISENCRHLKSIRLNAVQYKITNKTLRLFGQKCGHNLRSIAFNAVNRNTLKAFFRLTPNLVELEVIDLIDCCFADTKEVLLPQLKTITAGFDEYTDFTLFADQYSDRVENITLWEDIELWNPNHHLNDDMSDNRNIFQQLSRFSKLKTLSFKFISRTYLNLMNAGLTLIANNCRQLNALSIERIYFPIGSQETSFTTHLKCLARFSSLNELRISCCGLSDRSLDGIHLNAPKLKTIRLVFDTRNAITDRTLKSLAKLKELTFVDILSHSSVSTDDGIRDLLTNCGHIRRIVMNCNESQRKAIITEFILRAKNNTHYNYVFGIYCCYDWRSVSEVNQDLRENLSVLPKNIWIFYKKIEE